MFTTAIAIRPLKRRYPPREVTKIPVPQPCQNFSLANQTTECHNATLLQRKELSVCLYSYDLDRKEFLGLNETCEDSQHAFVSQLLSTQKPECLKDSNSHNVTCSCEPANCSLTVLMDLLKRWEDNSTNRGLSSCQSDSEDLDNKKQIKPEYLALIVLIMILMCMNIAH